MPSPAHLAALMELLEMVACPVCFSKVDLDQGGNALRCRGCGRAYPVEDGIPIMIAQRASGGPAS
jgi:hypothetical protein